MSDEKPIHERVSILETRMDHHETMLDMSMEKMGELGHNLVAQVERTNTILERFEEKLTTTSEKVKEWDTSLKTIGKIIVAVGILVGAVWSVFTFVVDHKTDVTISAKK